MVKFQLVHGGAFLSAVSYFTAVQLRGYLPIEHHGVVVGQDKAQRFARAWPVRYGGIVTGRMRDVIEGGGLKRLLRFKKFSKGRRLATGLRTELFKANG